MTPEQREKLEALAAAARPINDDEWGSERQIAAENAFHVFVSAELGADTEDMQTAKALSVEMIDEALRRVEMIHLCDEMNAYCDAHKLPHMSADELVCELQAIRDGEKSEFIEGQVADVGAHIKWLSDFISRWDAWTSWRRWQPRPEMADAAIVYADGRVEETKVARIENATPSFLTANESALLLSMLDTHSEVFNETEGRIARSIAAKIKSVYGDGPKRAMRVYYAGDGEHPRTMSLGELVATFKRTGVFATTYRTNEADMRNELDSRGWYEGNHDHGRFIVLNLAKMSLDLRDPAMDH
jgi:hypothetical protein